MSKKKNNRRTPKRPASPTSATPPPAEGPSKASAANPRWMIVAGVVSLAAAAFLLWMINTRPPRAPVAAPPAPPVSSIPVVVAANYSGNEACTGCHTAEHDAWHGSDHDLAMQVANETSVLGNFQNAKFTYAGTTSTFTKREGKFIVNTDGPDGQLHDYEIGYTFGVHPLQQYLIDFPDGRKQALSIAWDSRPKEVGGQRWCHLYPKDNVKAGDWRHLTNYSQNWNFTCA